MDEVARIKKLKEQEQAQAADKPPWLRWIIRFVVYAVTIGSVGLYALRFLREQGVAINTAGWLAFSAELATGLLLMALQLIVGLLDHEQKRMLLQVMAISFVLSVIVFIVIPLLTR